jgi:hypothetical protein
MLGFGASWRIRWRLSPRGGGHLLIYMCAASLHMGHSLSRRNICSTESGKPSSPVVIIILDEVQCKCEHKS